MAKRYFRNRYGKMFCSSSAGTYPINDGDPHNDDDEFDQDECDDAEAEYVDWMLSRMDEY